MLKRSLWEGHWPETNRVMLRNRRIGCSMSGIAQFIANRGVGALKEWMDTGYNHIQELDESIPIGWRYSLYQNDLLNHREQFPCLQVQPGNPLPRSRYYIRRMPWYQFSLVHLWKKRATNRTCFWFGGNDCVVQVPVDVGEGVRTLDKFYVGTIIACFLAHKYWADNQVSCRHF